MAGRFYLDENIAEGLVDALADPGHDAVSTKQLGTKGASDPSQLVSATLMGPVLVTHNSTDFRMLHEARGRWAALWDVTDRARHPGILVIEPGSGRQGGLSVSVMAEVVDRLAAEGDVTDRLFVWNEVEGLHDIQ